MKGALDHKKNSPCQYHRILGCKEGLTPSIVA